MKPDPIKTITTMNKRQLKRSGTSLEQTMHICLAKEFASYQFYYQMWEQRSYNLSKKVSNIFDSSTF